MLNNNNEQLQKREKRPRLAEKKKELEVQKKKTQLLMIPEKRFQDARDSRHVYDRELENFEWPEFEHHTQRIMDNTERYAQMTIEEAFADYYGMPKKKSKKKEVNPVGMVEVGDIINLRIKSVDKKGVHFWDDGFKEELVSAVNLFQYPRFKEDIPAKAIPVKVVAKTESKITVDPIAPLYDEWIKEHTTDLTAQRNLSKDKFVTVENLQLVRGFNNKGGGYYGSIKIDNVSKFLRQDVFVKGFVPGSQIVLNIENDFERWNGKSVKTFIISYDPAAIQIGKAGFVCSAKERLKFQGDKKKIEVFKEYTEDSDKWNEITQEVFDGSITGVIHSANKCGAFVEIPKLNITGIINCGADELVNFKRGADVKVRWVRFDENTYFNKDAGQIQHANPYTIEDGILKSCHLKAIFEVVK